MCCWICASVLLVMGEKLASSWMGGVCIDAGPLFVREGTADIGVLLSSRELLRRGWWCCCCCCCVEAFCCCSLFFIRFMAFWAWPLQCRNRTSLIGGWTRGTLFAFSQGSLTCAKSAFCMSGTRRGALWYLAGRLVAGAVLMVIVVDRLGLTYGTAHDASRARLSGRSVCWNFIVARRRRATYVS